MKSATNGSKAVSTAPQISEADAATYRKMRLFKHLNSEELNLVARALKTRRFKKGRSVIVEGTRGGTIYLVKTGLMKVSHLIRGRRRELGTFRPGDHFGEVAFVDGKPRSASIYAAQDSEVLSISRKSFETISKNNTRLQIKIMQALLEDLCDKLRDRKFSLDFELSDVLPIAVFETSADGNITFANRNGLDTFRYSHRDFEKGLKLLDLISAVDQTRASRFLKTIVKTGRPGTAEFIAALKKGSDIPVLLHAENVSEPSGFRVTIVNIYEQKKAQQALRESEERYRLVAETANDVIVTLDHQGLIQFVNKAVRSVFGYSPKKIIGSSLSLFIPGFTPGGLTLSRKKTEKGRWKDIELSGFHRSGREVPLELSVSEGVKDGKRLYTCIIRDVSERRKAEQALKMLEKAVENMKIGVSITDTNGKILYTNPAEARMHGYNVQELIGKDVRIFAPKELWNPMTPEQMREITNQVRESINLRRDGSIFQVQMISNVVTDADDLPIGIVTSCEDISERKRAEYELRESEERYRLLFESNPYPILVYDSSSFVILAVNEAAVRHYGYSRGEFLRMKIGRIAVRNSSSLKSDAVPESTARHRKKDGSIIDVEVSSHTLMFGGRSARLLITNDITRRKQMEEALKKAHDELEVRVQMRTAELQRTNRMLNEQMEERVRAEKELRNSEERYRAVMEQASEGIFLVDPDTRLLLEANVAFQNLLGYTREEITQKTLYDIVALDTQTIDRNIQRILTEELHSLGYRDYRRRDGSIVKVEVRVDLVSFGGKRVFCTVARDITERLKAEEEKLQLEENLRRAHMMETMGRLVSGVAHEVRNPLNALQATSEALQQDLGSNTEYKPFLDVIRSQVARLSELMRELLELGRPADKSRMQEESLSELCAAAVQLWKQTSADKNRQVNLLRSSGDPRANVDGARIQQVILNLLDNAAQHSSDGSTITVGTASKDGKIQVIVKDQGAGVAPEHLGRLFEPFFTTRRGGIGLGLSLVKHIVESHGGSVRLFNNDSEPGLTVELTFNSI